MDTIAAVAAKKLGKLLAKDFREIFGSAHNDEAERLGALARITIECIGRSDALYHTFEHTMLVTIVGRDILRGRTPCEPDRARRTTVISSPPAFSTTSDFVRGVLSGDTKTEFVIDKSGKTITLPRGASDASLAPYHVDRSKLFVYERLGNSQTIDAARVAEAIELTRFPPDPNSASEKAKLEPRLVQAADLIGQLGDPLYPRKANALFYELEEIGSNRQLGYASPADLVEKFPGFYWNTVSMHIEEGIKYLGLTASGRQWIANLHNHMFQRRAFQLADGPADLTASQLPRMPPRARNSASRLTASRSAFADLTLAIRAELRRRRLSRLQFRPDDPRPFDHRLHLAEGRVARQIFEARSRARR